jgi:hypothetical protein
MERRRNVAAMVRAIRMVKRVERMIGRSIVKSTLNRGNRNWM